MRELKEEKKVNIYKPTLKNKAKQSSPIIID